MREFCDWSHFIWEDFLWGVVSCLPGFKPLWFTAGREEGLPSTLPRSPEQGAALS